MPPEAPPQQEASLSHFLVPQFIDVESKVIGSITTRQFLIMMVAGMLDFIFYKLFYFNTFLVIAIVVTGIFGIVAFVKINGMPFHFFFLNLVQTLKKKKLRTWQKEGIENLPSPEKVEVKKELMVKAPITTSRLSSLSLIVNTGGAYHEE
ncbi:MAG: PrgI family protein [Candidatus Parcubacteria bacterium]|nr:PrgI family protein [Candidatus Parcubacteria bacterium]